MLSTFRVWFYFHPQLFQILSLYCRCHFCCSECVTSRVSRVDAFTGFKRSSNAFTGFKSVLSIAKGFRSHPLESYLQNPWWSTWKSIFCHVNGGCSAKKLCLPKNSWNPTNNQTLLMTFPWISLLPKLPLFAPRAAIKRAQARRHPPNKILAPSNPKATIGENIGK